MYTIHIRVHTTPSAKIITPRAYSSTQSPRTQSVRFAQSAHARPCGFVRDSQYLKKCASTAVAAAFVCLCDLLEPARTASWASQSVIARICSSMEYVHHTNILHIVVSVCCASRNANKLYTSARSIDTNTQQHNTWNICTWLVDRIISRRVFVNAVYLCVCVCV